MRLRYHPNSAPPGANAIYTSILILVVGSIAGLAWFYVARRSSSSAGPADRERASAPAASQDDAAPGEIAYTNDAIETATADCYKLAFGVTRFDYQIMGEHAIVLERIGQAVDQSVHQRDYFPRRPMLLPKLMQALNDPEVARETLVKLILEDPSIAGGVLQQANSAFYRVSPARVDSIDRAVWLLGTDGLRRLMATAIMQPVFRLPKGYFDGFAPLTWEQAQRAAAAAEAYAKGIPGVDLFVAQLLAVLEPLARIVIFRLGLDKYREMPNVLPRAEVLIRAMQRHSTFVALRIANAWEMSDLSVSALRDQAQRASPTHMRELGQTVYFACLTSTLTVLASRSPELHETYMALLVAQTQDADRAELLWHAALAATETG